MSALSGIEVSTTAIRVLLAGFEKFPSLVQRLIKQKGILTAGPDGKVVIEDNRWFPLDAWLSVLEIILREIGPNAAFTLGTHIMVNPKFPPWIRDVDTALESIDLAFHRSHRKNGVLMGDEATGVMLEGIGHYRSRRVPAEQRIEVTSDTPYPCDVDFGIVTGMATKFEPKSRATHGAGPCRRFGGSSCSYTVIW